LKNKDFKLKLSLSKKMATQDQDQQQQQKPIRVLVSKLGLDGHDRGALVICRALRDAGMEVIYSGLFCSPEQVAKTAIDEDVDAVAMSLLNGAHLTLFPKVARLLKERGINDILLVGGGVIPESDKKILEKEGITGNFGPGTPLSIIIDHIRTNVKNSQRNKEQNQK
jgi:methylmalonyl-CoA mutase C-terminal domain/subunit